MINISMICPNRDDSTSFYRGWGPMAETRKNSGLPLNLIVTPAISWSTLTNIDLIFMQRPFSADHAKVFEVAKFANVPVWIDYDDALWNIEPDKAAYRIYSIPGTIDRINQFVRMADVTTVSTQEIANQLKHSGNITVIPNELPKYWRHHPRQITRNPDNKQIIRIAWRGSSTHDADWFDHLPAVLSVLDAFLKIEFVFMGTPPHWAVEQISKTVYTTVIPETYVERYFNFLTSGAAPPADIMFVPLRDSLFNRAKSNIALLEATAGGMITVAPDWPQWRSADPSLNTFLYEDATQVADRLNCAIHFVRNHQKIVCENLLALQQEHLLDARGADQRANIIKQLCPKEVIK